MKILLSDQIRAADRYTIENEPIPSIELMERASRAFVSGFLSHYSSERPVWVFCGTGNNGGDGLAIARLLLQKRFQVRVFIVGNADGGSPDFRTNLGRFKLLTSVESADENFAEKPRPGTLIIDALFGTGLTRPAAGVYENLIKKINSFSVPVIAVDVPSGLFCERPQGTAPAIEATLTISFQLPKLAFLMPENFRYTGEWKIVDIGLSEQFLSKSKSPYYLQLRGDREMRLPARPKHMHKGLAGRILLVGGSYGKVGAILLAARACLRAGGGLLTVHGPRCATMPLHANLPEAMMQTGEDENIVSGITAVHTAGYDVIAAGPGLGTATQTAAAFHSLLQNCRQPMVLDADALNLLAQNPDWLETVPKGSILTPHPGEFRRLVGDWADDYERLEKQIDFAKNYQLTVVVKGAFTSVCAPDGQVYFNSTGNPGMAKGGSGDVLTGIIAALLGQGFSGILSARLAVMLHGLAGDLAAREKGEYSMLPTDLIEKLPEAFAGQQ